MMSEQTPVFALEKIYLKDASLEVPHAPAIYLEREAPQIDVQLHTEGSAMGEDYYDVTVTVTVTAKLGDKVMFLNEVAQAGIFRIAGIPQEEIDPVLGIACPNILFPYAREVVSDMTTRAGFPPVLLNPINFEALYQQQMQQSQGASH